MEEKALSREEIALSVLNGILSSLGPTGPDAQVLAGDGSHQDTDRQTCYTLAFQMADLFILERNKKG